jgi:hypothetical protein
MVTEDQAGELVHLHAGQALAAFISDVILV